jgi:hypothetical protein
MTSQADPNVGAQAPPAPPPPPPPPPPAESHLKRSLAQLVLGEASLLILLPALGYLLAYTYQQGACRAFRVPTALIRLDLSTVLVGTYYGVLGVAGFGFIMFVARQLSPHKSPLRMRVAKMTGIVGMSVMFLSFGGREYWVPLLVACLFGAALEFGLPLLHTEAKGYQAKMAASDARNAADSAATSRLMFGTWWSTMLYFAFIAAVSANARGDGDARDQTSFLVRATDKKETVVLRVYGDILIVAPVDRATKTIRPEFEVVEAKVAGPLRLEEIGPLKPE